MSRQQIRFHGQQQFRPFPFLDSRSLPVDIDVKSYTRHALDRPNSLGTRIRDPASGGSVDRHIRGPGTEHRYLFWENYASRPARLLRRLDTPRAELGRFRSGRDGWVYGGKDRLKLHRDIVNYEDKQNSQLKQRLAQNLSLPSEVDYSGYLSQLNSSLAPRIYYPADYLTNEEDVADAFRRHFPPNFDDLPKWPRLKARGRHSPGHAHHVGWSHSDEVDSWFFDDDTPTAHDDYIDFYVNCHKQKTAQAKLNNRLILPTN